MDFNSLDISSLFVERLKEKKIEIPTPIQRLGIPKILSRDSVLASSQTGSGKTLAYLLPIVQTLTKTQGKALILAPTRELALQINEVCAFLCDVTNLHHCVIYGGVEYEVQKENLKLNPNIIISTPGRLIDLLDQKATTIDSLSFFVLDEVDQMLDLGFYEHIISLAELRSHETTTLCFSATLPDKIKDVVFELKSDITLLNIENEKLAVERIEQTAYFAEINMMDLLLIHLLRSEKPNQAVIFTRSRKMADRLVKVLSGNNITAEAMHSDRSQAARQHILERFRHRETEILVATDVIARGIDLDTISHVFNFGLPQNNEQYIHRIGRTARAGRHGKAISLCDPSEKPMLESICKFMKQNIPINMSHPYMTLPVIRLLNSQNINSTKKKKNKR